MMVFNNKRTEVAKLLLLIDPTDSPPLANVINKLETVMRSIRNQCNKTRISQISSTDLMRVLNTQYLTPLLQNLFTYHLKESQLFLMVLLE